MVTWSGVPGARQTRRSSQDEIVSDIQRQELTHCVHLVDDWYVSPMILQQNQAVFCGHTRFNPITSMRPGCMRKREDAGSNRVLPSRYLNMYSEPPKPRPPAR